MFVPMSLCMHMGYGVNSWLRKFFGDDVGRGIWGLLVGLSASLSMVLTGHLHFYWFILYLALNFLFEKELKDLPQDVGDPLIGLGVASLIMLVK